MIHKERTAEQALQLMDLLDIALADQSLEELADGVLPGIARTMHADSVFLYMADSRLPKSHFSQQGMQPETASKIENLCTEQFDHLSSLDKVPDTNLRLYPLRTQGGCVGLVGLEASEDVPFNERFFRPFAQIIDRLIECEKSTQQLAHLNTYLTISSMLSQPLDLHELLETTLYCCMEAVSAEAASVLLLDDEKKNFGFYNIEGPAKPVLKAATFPADKGLAGSILQMQQSEVINDVHDDPRFYEQVDSESGFQTRNMIAVPLTAGEEQVGVLEVLNKAGEGSFTDEEHMLLLSIAEEIAFAIRNAKVFEYVVNSYCKQRQGQASCRGCDRPLGSWTPCIKYREVVV
ncbi:MAG: GAF domain-containing protein [Chloroflexi bacterium]|nr:GAF domain-containing protein [Chloroflexota bacterium]